MLYRWGGRGPLSGAGLVILVVAMFNNYCLTSGNVQASEEEGPEEYKSYNGYSLVRVLLRSEVELRAVRDLINRDLPGVLVLQEPRGDLRPIDLLVSEESKEQVLTELDQLKISYTVREDHVESLLQEHRRVRRSAMRWGFEPRCESSASNFSFDVYHTYEEIVNWLDRKGHECGDMCEVVTIGKTYEQRDMKVIKIGRSSNKPVIWLDGGIHAREWIAPATAICIINKLLDVDDRDGQYLLSRFRFVVLPLINADGYAYTWSRDRMWRKTRSQQDYSQQDKSQKSCRGVDLNRNFGYKWGGLGASTNSCSESYRGPQAFSEVESRVMSEYILNTTRKQIVLVYISLHSYGQYFLTSWGYSKAVPPDFNELMNVAKQATIDIEKIHGSVYQYGSAGRLLYAASGGSDDWAKGSAGIKYSYTIELRDTGDYQFLLPPQYILATCEETMAGLRSVARSIHRSRSRSLRRLSNRPHH